MKKCKKCKLRSDRRLFFEIETCHKYIISFSSFGLANQFAAIAAAKLSNHYETKDAELFREHTIPWRCQMKSCIARFFPEYENGCTK